MRQSTTALLHGRIDTRLVVSFGVAALVSFAGTARAQACFTGAGSGGSGTSCADTNQTVSTTLFSLANAGTGTTIEGNNTNTSSGGNGVAGVSSGLNGVQGNSSSSAASGVYGENDATAGGYGVAGRTTTTSGGGIGVYGQCDATTNACYGVNGVTNSPVGFGVIGQVNASSPTAAAGVYGIGTSTVSSGVPVAPGVQVGTGHAYFNGSNPSSSQAYKNTLTPKNIVKAWGNFDINGSGGVSVTDGFNISSVATGPNSNQVKITFSEAMGSANYAAVVTSEYNQSGVVMLNEIDGRTSTTLTVGFWDCGVGGCSTVSTSSTGFNFDVVVLSAQ